MGTCPFCSFNDSRKHFSHVSIELFLSLSHDSGPLASCCCDRYHITLVNVIHDSILLLAPNHVVNPAHNPRLLVETNSFGPSTPSSEPMSIRRVGSGHSYSGGQFSSGCSDTQDRSHSQPGIISPSPWWNHTLCVAISCFQLVLNQRCSTWYHVEYCIASDVWSCIFHVSSFVRRRTGLPRYMRGQFLFRSSYEAVSEYSSRTRMSIQDGNLAQYYSFSTLKDPREACSSTAEAAFITPENPGM